MDQRTIDRLAAVIAVVALVIGLATISLGRIDSGIRLATSGEYVVVSEVQPRSLAAQYGLRPGMIVTELQGVTLVRLPLEEAVQTARRGGFAEGQTALTILLAAERLENLR